MSRWRSRIAPFIAGIATVFAVTYVINNTQLADRLLASLLLSSTSGQADVIVVLGAGVTGTCSPNLNSLRRALLAAEAFRAQRAPRMLLTGGAPDARRCPVAEAMGKVVQQTGVADEAMLVETGSRSTYENARLSAPMLRGIGARRLLLVTDRLHGKRARATFEAFGFSVELALVPVWEGHRDNTEMLYAGLREFAALGYYRWKGWIGAPVPSDSPAHQHGPTFLQGGINVTHPEGPIVILGASYAAGWTPAPVGTATFVNKGVPGQQSTEMLDRFDTDVVALNPRAVILWGFINDIFRAPRPDIDAVIERIKQNYREMVTRARAHGIDPILATEVVVREPSTLQDRVMTFIGGILGRRGYQDYINDHVRAVNAWMRTMAAREGLTLLDLEAALADRSGRRARAFAQADGSHITAAGYEAISAHSAATLARRFAGSAAAE